MLPRPGKVRPLEQKYADDNKETFTYGLTYTYHYNPENEYTVTSRDSTGLVTYFIEQVNGDFLYTTAAAAVTSNPKAEVATAAAEARKNYRREISIDIVGSRALSNSPRFVPGENPTCQRLALACVVAALSATLRSMLSALPLAGLVSMVVSCGDCPSLKRGGARLTVLFDEITGREREKPR